MKTLKKVFSMLIAVCMMIVLCIPAFAETSTYTISVPTTDTHTYAVYQIFTGDLSGTTLSNIKWGQNCASSYTTGDAVADTVISALTAVSNSTDSEKLKVITTYADLAGTAYGTVSASSPLTNVPAGYYLLKDSSTLTADDAYTTYIVEVVDNVTVSRKAAQPTVDKQVKDESADKDTASTDSEGWGETADHAINETFQFKLIATLPNDPDLDDYSTYKLVFNDTLSKGITYDSNMNVVVTWSDGTKTTLTTSQYIVTNSTDSTTGVTTLTVTISDLKAIATANEISSIQGAVVTVTYDAHLNENAVIGNNDDNQNKVNLEYSNNPNVGGEGSTGKTPDDTVYVFTYEVDNTKYSESVAEGNELAGAEFKLFDSTGTTEIGLIYDSTLNAYRPVKSGETSTAMTSDSNGKFNIVGLDAGTYVLKETKTPDGYNTCDDITIVISGTHSENADNASATDTIQMTVNGETATANNVVNKKGSSLPETGGMGTTIFYVVGGVMVAGAAILLITKKRMGNDAE